MNENITARIRILIMDDEPLIRRALSDYLEELGYETVDAEDGARGLEIARAERFHMVLVDLRMPRVDGMEVITTLKAEQPDLPAVVISGTGVLDEVVQAIRLGAWDYISKPIHDMDEIVVVIERVLEKARLISERDQYQSALEALNRRLETEVLRRTLDLRMRNRDLTVLNRVIGAATANSDPAQILRVLCAEVALAFDLPRAFAMRIQAERHVAVIAAEHCESSACRFQDEISLDCPLFQHILQHPLPLYISDISNDARLGDYRDSLLSRNTCSLLLVPLVVREQVVSVLVLEAEVALAYEDDDLRLIQNAAAAAAQSLETLGLYQELREHAEDLENTVALRTAELRVALKQARAADEAKSQFLSNVSHELRTPLSSIWLYLDLLTQGRPEKHAHYIESLQRESRRLQTLIDELLDLSRLDLGKTRMQLRAVDLNRLLDTLVKDRATLFAQRQLRLTFAPVNGPAIVGGDPELLEQVATNLLTNAMHYTPSGGDVRLQTGIRSGDAAAWITFSVADTGPGISEEEQSQLFQRFFRGAAGQASDAPGTGLGLAICQEIVSLHQGKITVESAPGVGATFIIWLPTYSTSTSTPISAH